MSDKDWQIKRDAAAAKATGGYLDGERVLCEYNWIQGYDAGYAEGLAERDALRETLKHDVDKIDAQYAAEVSQLHARLTEANQLVLSRENWVARKIEECEALPTPNLENRMAKKDFADKAVDQIFKDLRDRRFLKWLFDDHEDNHLIARFESKKEEK